MSFRFEVEHVERELLPRLPRPLTPEFRRLCNMMGQSTTSGLLLTMMYAFAYGLTHEQHLKL